MIDQRHRAVVQGLHPAREFSQLSLRDRGLATVGIVWFVEALDERSSVRALEQRFGDLPGGINARLAAATDQDLQRWTRRVLTASELDSVFAAE